MSKIDDFVEKIDKKLKDKFGGEASKSPLNPFLYDYYDNLRGQELAEAIDNTSYLMEYNTKVIKFLKKKIPKTLLIKGFRDSGAGEGT